MRLTIYEDSPKYDLWVKMLLGLVPVVLLVLGLLISLGVLPTETEAEARRAPIILFACIAFVLLLYWTILPRRYQIMEDKLKIVLGGLFSFSIYFDDIDIAREAKGFIHIGVGFATSVNRLEIVRRKGMRVVISPRNQDLFVQNLNKALSDWRRNHG